MCNNYLLPPWLKGEINSLRFALEKDLHVKVYLYDPSHPRKNITFCVFGDKESR
jgi:hypothetical protein